MSHLSEKFQDWRHHKIWPLRLWIVTGLRHHHHAGVQLGSDPFGLCLRLCKVRIERAHDDECFRPDFAKSMLDDCVIQVCNEPCECLGVARP